jgi:hypothetical protein
MAVRFLGFGETVENVCSLWRNSYVWCGPIPDAQPNRGDGKFHGSGFELSTAGIASAWVVGR